MRGGWSTEETGPGRREQAIRRPTFGPHGTETQMNNQGSSVASYTSAPYSAPSFLSCSEGRRVRGGGGERAVEVIL